MSQKILKPTQNLVATKYFTARISYTPNNPDKHKRQATFLDAAESLPDTHVFYGHYLTKEVRCHRCGNTWLLPEEKMTDVNIAIEMLQDAFEDSFDVAFLVSGDSDLAAPVKTILRRYPKKRIIVVSPLNRKSQKLKSLATGYINLGEDVLRNSLLPDVYVKPDGTELKRPGKWK
ncbi:MAG: NYN domain protein [Candidatus Hydrogenedentes bacterium ADurb.Bin101]|jgi:uncharacterized LabA/DUF88 family protein|nr:MAG: NYN domain protein [Candidatus Hydrogenedentes bacterium ADurb.Bin101]